MVANVLHWSVAKYTACLFSNNFHGILVPICLYSTKSKGRRYREKKEKSGREEEGREKKQGQGRKRKWKKMQKTREKDGRKEKLLYGQLFFPLRDVRSKLVKATCTDVMPWWMMEFLRVLQIIRSVHWTITIDMKNAVWHVNSSTLRCAYVYARTTHGRMYARAYTLHTKCNAATDENKLQLMRIGIRVLETAQQE